MNNWEIIDQCCFPDVMLSATYFSPALRKKKICDPLRFVSAGLRCRSKHRQATLWVTGLDEAKVLELCLKVEAKGKETNWFLFSANKKSQQIKANKYQQKEVLISFFAKKSQRIDIFKVCFCPTYSFPSTLSKDSVLQLQTKIQLFWILPFFFRCFHMFCFNLLVGLYWLPPGLDQRLPPQVQLLGGGGKRQGGDLSSHGQRCQGGEPMRNPWEPPMMLFIFV